MTAVDLKFIEDLAWHYLDEHGLLDEGWAFKWDNAKSRAGVCDHSHKAIGLSKFVTKYRSYEDAEDTILHEIAHALVGPRHGHGPVWRAKAREIGAKPERCFDSEDLPLGKYEARCLKCGAGELGFRWRRTKKEFTHTRCGGDVHWVTLNVA